MNTFHRIVLADGLMACVALRPANDSVQLVVAPCSESGVGHDCAIPAGVELGGLPARVDPNLSAEKVALVIRRLMDQDAQVAASLFAGEIVYKRVAVQDPAPLNLWKDSPSVRDFREMRLTSGEFVRPMLLAAPPLEYLRPFQVRGVQWLLGKPRGILADDMGLGKTIQAITALRLLFNSGEIETALVVCPKSLLANWEEELSRWAPELSRVRVLPSASARDKAWRILVGKVHVLLTNYEQMRQPPMILEKRGVDVLIADEAHRVRNIGAIVAKGIRRVSAKRFWALTGTPIERDSGDLATLLSTIEPARFAVTDRTTSVGSLRAQARPYLLRRLKSEVMGELPEVLETKETLELTRSQWSSYKRVCGDVAALDDAGFLAVINELRTICDYDEHTGASAKAERIGEILEDVRSSGEKAIVFSYLLRPLDILQETLAGRLGADALVSLRGSMETEARGAALRRFKEDPKAMVLLASSRVASEGLTLTEANHVIFFNEWWNPSANQQAQDRVIRIGQERGVRVYKFRCRGTIEEDLEAILQEKSKTVVELIDRLAEPSGSIDDLRPIISKLRSRVLGQSD